MKKIIIYMLSACLLMGCTSANNSKKPAVNHTAEEEKKEQYVIQDTELPDFDYTPINFQNKGYIVSVDGKFGMMDAFGNWMKHTDYGSLFTAYIDKQDLTYCAVPTGEAVMGGGFSFNTMFSDERSVCANSGFGGVVGYFVYMLDENGKYVLHYRDLVSYNNNVDEGTEVNWSKASLRGNALMIPLMKDPNNYDYSQYFIGTVDGTIYGPFDKSYQAAISQDGVDYNKPFQRFYTTGYELFGHFVVPEDDGYRIYNNRGDKSFDKIVDSYKFITDEQIQYTIGKTVGILDKDCNVIIETDEFEDISTPMQGLFFAKKDGKWHVVRDTNVSDDDLYVTPEYVENRGTPYIANYEMAVRSEPSKSANKVDRIIQEGETVKVYETKYVNANEQWGRIDENQWVCISDLDNTYFYLN